MPWLAIGEFLLKIVTGDVWHLWQEHKLKEAQNAQNDVAAMSQSDLDKRVQSDLVRK